MPPSRYTRTVSSRRSRLLRTSRFQRGQQPRAQVRRDLRGAADERRRRVVGQEDDRGGTRRRRVAGRVGHAPAGVPAALEAKPDIALLDIEMPGLDGLSATADGSAITDIARRLHLSEGTVRNYLSEAIAKLGASNRVDAARIARTKGWL